MILPELLLGRFFYLSPLACLVREQISLRDAHRKLAREILGEKRPNQLSALDARLLRDTRDFYRQAQWRYLDVVLGAAPPTFPLFLRENRHADGDTEYDHLDDDG